MQRLSSYVVSVMPTQPNVLVETCRFLSLSPNDFLSVTLPYTLPQLFATCNLPAIEAISNELVKTPANLLFETSADVLAHVFLLKDDKETEKALAFMVEVLSRGSNKKKISLANVIKGWIIPLLAKLVIALGDPKNFFEDDVRTFVLAS